MKNLLFSLTAMAVLLGSGSLCRAQDEKPTPANGARAGLGGGVRFNLEERLKIMTERLGLSQDQQDKIKAIYEKNRGKFDELKNAPEDRRREKARELMVAQREEVNKVLTPAQLEKARSEIGQRVQGGNRPGRAGAPKTSEAKPE
jgi:Spy/CpxP family protein refolding chaperone